MFWLPYFLVNRLRFPLDASGYVSALYELAGVAGALLDGYVPDRRMQARREPISAIMVLAFGAIALLRFSIRSLVFYLESAAGGSGNGIRATKLSRAQRGS